MALALKPRENEAEVEKVSPIYNDVEALAFGDKMAICKGDLCYNAVVGIKRRDEMPRDSVSLKYKDKTKRTETFEKMLFRAKRGAESLGYGLSNEWLSTNSPFAGTRFGSPSLFSGIITAVEANNIEFAYKYFEYLRGTRREMDDLEKDKLITIIQALHDPIAISASLRNIIDGKEYIKKAYPDIDEELANQISIFIGEKVMETTSKEAIEDVCSIVIPTHGNIATGINSVVGIYKDFVPNKEILKAAIDYLLEVGYSGNEIKKILREAANIDNSNVSKEDVESAIKWMERPQSVFP